MAEDAAGLAARELGHVRVLLLRHDRGAGAEAVGQADEAEARAHPQHQLLGDRRERCIMTSAAQAQNSMAKSRSDTASSELRADAVEAELARHALAVDREGGAGERGGAERQHG